MANALNNPLVEAKEAAPLNGLKAFVVEDEPLVSMLVQDILSEFGCVVVGSASSVSDALSQVTGNVDLDVAILDVNLHGDKSFPIADALIEQGTPFLFATGFGPADIAERYPDVPLVHKPFTPYSLAQTLSGLAKH